jgi:hypothetical protein
VQFFEREARVEPSQVQSEAVVDPMAEGEVLGDLARAGLLFARLVDRARTSHDDRSGSDGAELVLAA